MQRTITTTHLIMNSPAALSPRLLEGSGLAIHLIDPPNPHLNHAFFMEVGTPYYWFSRLDWDFDQWQRYLSDPTVNTWLGLIGGVPYGYFELQSRNGVTEIMFFGLLSTHTGRGLGGHLLTRAVERAWSIPGTEQVYVHTCTEDHSGALSNYVARGFTVDREETKEKELPEDDAPIWSSPAYYRSLRESIS
jgi:GNAT superfamily N-acetyltransferase